eukprot:TRINITY_DN130_c0_g5_i1.p1 TRINITY_DN130_c0_g5~~TRINITY_DN130_c0_g5_i1.p1  ORF type:complete len:1231 (+),score=445.00 TRINITY_DN130_c0_g5_i1:147-3695(+)
MACMDGNTAAAHVAYAISDNAFLYPITPSTPMGESCDEWASQGRQNIYGNTLSVTQMQSEAGAAGALHGSLSAGSMATTFTASQGLLLMIPNMYIMAAQHVPSVIHVASRALARQALSIYNDNSDVMACRSTGFCMLASGSVQESMDLALVSHVAALKAELPFMHFFDGFRTSHEVNKINVIDYDTINELVPHELVLKHRQGSLNSMNPKHKGTGHSPAIYMQNVFTAQENYKNTPEIVQEVMDQVAEKTGRQYHLFDYSGAADAEKVIVLMCSATGCAEETVNALSEQGEKVGVLKVRLFRPFSTEHMMKALPTSVKKLVVMDRTVEDGASGEPLYLDVVTSVHQSGRDIEVIGGRFGLGSKEFTPAMVKACLDNADVEEPKQRFAVGINDDICNTSLEVGPRLPVVPEGTRQCLFWGMGSDGTVGANKSAIKIIGDNTDKYAQAHFVYSAHKSGGVTVSHLRFGPEPINSSYEIQEADYVACSSPTYMEKFDVVGAVNEEGTFVLNCNWTPEELETKLPAAVKRTLAERNVDFYTIDASAVAVSAGLPAKRINQVMQACFFHLSNVLPIDEAFKLLNDAIAKDFWKHGADVIAQNQAAVSKAVQNLHKIDIPAHWKDATDEFVQVEGEEKDAFITNILEPIMQRKAGKLPVSAFEKGGNLPTNTTRFEKRGVAHTVPIWDQNACIQCNSCSIVCPHAAIRPFLLDGEETVAKPDVMNTVKARGVKGYQFRIQVSPLDCTGCSVCATACPVDALTMTPLDDVRDVQSANFDFCDGLPMRGELFKKDTVKGSQFNQPLLEFSGACAGCGESAYVKLATQLCGERMVIANASGCSSVWMGTGGISPLARTPEGFGPAWERSLFEDNAEFGYGIHMGYRAQRLAHVEKTEAVIEAGIGSDKLRKGLKKWLDVRHKGDNSQKALKKLLPILEREAADHPELATLQDLKHLFVTQSTWIVGGDGWAYDIGYGGLDHVLASGENVNVLVMDTEMYSNTGGQMAKSTPKSAVVKFASGGKKTEKKDLALMAMTYDDVYVASVCMGADPKQCVRAFKEAEDYKGPSLIIGYSPCEGHTIKRGGLSRQLEASQAAVESGYWPLFRRNPDWAKKGKHVFKWDSKKEPNAIQEFLDDQARFDVLRRSNPELADKLQGELKEKTMLRNELYVKMAMNEAEFHEYLSSKYSEHE